VAPLNRKIVIFILSILAIILLTAQTCSFGYAGGTSCYDDDDCSDGLICANGYCVTDTSGTSLEADCGSGGDVTATPGDTIDFTGSSSTGADSYAWDFGDSTGTSTDADPTYSYDTSDVYSATLTVTDVDGATDSCSVAVSVVECTDDDNSACGGFDCMIEGTCYAVCTPSDTEGCADGYECSSDGTTCDSTATLAVCSPDLLDVYTTETVSFSALGSLDYPGTGLDYSWDFDGDGTEDISDDPDAAEYEWTYDTADTYDATLMVTDDDATESSTTCDSITVTDICEKYDFTDLEDIGSFYEDYSWDTYKEDITFLQDDTGDSLITFISGDGTSVTLAVFGDGSTYGDSSGHSEDEPAFWGASDVGPLYLEGETCQGTSSVEDCEDAYFLFIESDGDPHVMGVGDIDVTHDTISFYDATYGVQDTGILYTDETSTELTLSGAGISLYLTVHETDMAVTFDTVGSTDGVKMSTDHGATIEIINADTTTQEFEGLILREYDHGLTAGGPVSVTVTATYDDLTDSRVEFSSTTTGLVEGTDGYWEYDDGTTVYFMTWQGSAFGDGDMVDDGMTYEDSFMMYHMGPSFPGLEWLESCVTFS
jgi:PKD repeat protein